MNWNRRYFFFWRPDIKWNSTRIINFAFFTWFSFSLLSNIEIYWYKSSVRVRFHKNRSLFRFELNLKFQQIDWLVLKSMWTFNITRYHVNQLTLLYVSYQIKKKRKLFATKYKTKIFKRTERNMAVIMRMKKKGGF